MKVKYDREVAVCAGFDHDVEEPDVLVLIDGESDFFLTTDQAREMAGLLSEAADVAEGRSA